MGAADRNQAFQNAERLLRAGKVSAALQEFRSLADAAPRDLQMLNRIGDSLARAGRNGEAVSYYERIADQFASSGFYPKAVAIVKKAARLDPDRVEVLVRLGEYNLRQKFLGEAKAHLLRAGDLLVRSGQIERARQVFERLVSADPSDVLNRVRLAEARAAAGDAARATEELVAAARQFAGSGRGDDAERTFRRAQQLSPASAEPVSALAAYLASVGREDDGLSLLATTAAERPDDTTLRGEWFVLLEHLGRTEASAAFLDGEESDGISPAAVERALTETIARGGSEDLWSRLDPLVRRWTDGKRFEKVTTLLERLTRVEPQEHLPALDRLLAAREAEGDPRATARVVERLLALLQRRGDAERVAPLRDRLRELDPASPSLLDPEGAPVRGEEARGPESLQGGAPETVSPPPQPSPPVGTFLRFEAPAVPLSPADHEFVTGHLTEAEVFLKYSLADEALHQLREVAVRFPGHVEALERLVELLTSRGEPKDRQAILIDLAWARRASGDERGARAALDSAAGLGPLDEDVQTAALHFGLVAATDGIPERPTKPPAEPAPSRPETPRAHSSTDSSDEEWVIEFEADEAESEGPREAPAEGPAAEPRPYARLASPDMIEEIRSLAESPRMEEALRKVEALRILGFGGAELDALEERLRARRPADTVERFDEEDLSTLTAALASDLSEAVTGADHEVAEEEEAEQSLDEVFDAFKRHVDETVHAEDYRTRYDLGIAYKEMGLFDEALAAFEEATRSPELFREACTMLALCHRERGDTEQAVTWYRRALGGDDEGTPDLHGIRYDLAEVLLERGETEDALHLFRSVLESDPSYRDVRRYVNELQGQVDG